MLIENLQNAMKFSYIRTVHTCIHTKLNTKHKTKKNPFLHIKKGSEPESQRPESSLALHRVGLLNPPTNVHFNSDRSQHGLYRIWNNNNNNSNNNVTINVNNNNNNNVIDSFHDMARRFFEEERASAVDAGVGGGAGGGGARLAVRRGAGAVGGGAPAVLPAFPGIGGPGMIPGSRNSANAIQSITNQVNQHWQNATGGNRLNSSQLNDFQSRLEHTHLRSFMDSGSGGAGAGGGGGMIPSSGVGAGAGAGDDRYRMAPPRFRPMTMQRSDAVPVCILSLDFYFYFSFYFFIFFVFVYRILWVYVCALWGLFGVIFTFF